MNEGFNIASLVSYQVYPAKMGGQKGIALFYQYLSKLVPITIISTRNNVPAANDRIRFVPALSNAKIRYINPLLFFTVRRFIKKNNITHLILEHPYYGWLGLFLKWFSKIKLIVHSHNIEALRFKSMGRWWWGILWHYEKLIHRKADLSFFIQDDDRKYAIEKFNLKPGKCVTITYGIEIENPPSAAEKRAAGNVIRERYGIAADKKIMLFNGTLDYKPNQDALDIILNKLNPLLLENTDFSYTIIICGNRLPAAYKNLEAYAGKNIVSAGFVDDISVFFKGADIFINPVIDGGGIKTKVVEALGYDLSVISTQSGAIGIPVSITGDKMTVIAGEDWSSFAAQVPLMDSHASIPQKFFDHFYWGNIAAKAFESIKQIQQ